MIDYNERQYLDVLGFGNDLPIVVSDGGNNQFKMLCDRALLRNSNKPEVIIFDHAIAEIDQGTYERLMHYYGRGDASHLVQWRGRFFVVGEQAYSINPGFMPLSGRAKMTRDYYGIMFMHGVAKLFNGRVPEEINAFLAHPPGDLEHRDTLMKSVHGKWSIEIGARQIKTNVVYTNAFEEIVGGIHNTTHGVDGQLVEGNPLEGKGPFLALDLGGGSLDLAWIKKDLSIDYNRPMYSERIGVNTALRAFKQAFDVKYKHLLRDAEDGIPRDVVLSIFMDESHQVNVAGEILDCTEMYNQSAAPVIRQMLRTVQQFAKGFVGVGGALLTGGGSAAFYDKIGEQVLPLFKKNGAIFRSAKLLQDMIKANSEGGLKVAKAMRAVGKDEAAQYLKASGHGKRTQR